MVTIGLRQVFNRLSVLTSVQTLNFPTLHDTADVIGHLIHELLDFGAPFETGRKSVRNDNLTPIIYFPVPGIWSVRPLKYMI